MSKCKYCGYDSDKYYCPSCGLKKKDAEQNYTDVIGSLETIKKDINLNSENISLYDYVRVIKCSENLQLVKTTEKENIESDKKQIFKLINKYKKKTMDLIGKKISEEDELKSQENINKVIESFIGNPKEENIKKETKAKKNKNNEINENRKNNNEVESTENVKKPEKNNTNKKNKSKHSTNDIDDLIDEYTNFNNDNEVESTENVKKPEKNNANKKNKSKHSINDNDESADGFTNFNNDNIPDYVPYKKNKQDEETKPVSEEEIKMGMKPKGASFLKPKDTKQNEINEGTKDSDVPNSSIKDNLKPENEKVIQDIEEKQKPLKIEKNADFIQMIDENNLGNNLFVEGKNNDDLTGILNDEDDLIQKEHTSLFHEIPDVNCTVDTEKNLFEEIEISSLDNNSSKYKKQKKKGKHSKKDNQDKQKKSKKKIKKVKSQDDSKKNTLKIKRGQKIVIIDPSKGEEYDGYYNDVEVQGTAETTFEFGIISGNAKLLIGMGVVALLGAILIIKSILGIIE